MINTKLTFESVRNSEIDNGINLPLFANWGGGGGAQNISQQLGMGDIEDLSNHD